MHIFVAQYRYWKPFKNLVVDLMTRGVKIELCGP